MSMEDLLADGVEESIAMQVTIEKSWKKYDTDGSGTISKSELQDLIDDIDDTFLKDEDNNIDDIMEELDSIEKDGVLSQKEFTDWWIGKQGQNKLRKLADQAVKKNKTDIHKASWEGDVRMVKHFIELSQKQGHNIVDAQDKTPFGDLNTPLHYAAYNGNLELCQLLVDNGARINSKNSADCTPLFLASQQGQCNVVEYLLQTRRAAVNVVDKMYSLSPFDVAANDSIRKLFKDVGGTVAPSAPSQPNIKRVEAKEESGAAIVVTFDKSPPPESLPLSELPVNGYIIEVIDAKTKMCAREVSEVAESGADKAFRGWDADGDGGISFDEFEDVIESLDKTFFSDVSEDEKPDVLKRLFEELDADRSETIDKGEFIDWLRASDKCRINSSKKLKEKLDAWTSQNQQHDENSIAVRVEGLAENTKYFARVAVVNGMGRGTDSKPSKEVRTWKRPGNIQWASDPDQDFISADPTKVQLEWKPLVQESEKHQVHKNNPIKEIIVFGAPKTLSSKVKQTYKIVGSVLKPYETNTFTVKQLSENTDYVFRLAARNKSGRGEKTEPIQVRTCSVKDQVKRSSNARATFGELNLNGIRSEEAD